jgi:enediyne polyketide synthase
VSAVASPIAIVGLGCEYPDASTPGELWENVLAGRRAFRRLPAERLRLEDYWSADRAAVDRLYATEAAVIEGYEFDRVAFRVPGPAFRSADTVHWLALDVALRALADAGLGDDDLPRATTGVVLGNTLTGEQTRAGLMRLRWPYVRRVVDAELRAEGHLDASGRASLLARIEATYKAPFEPVGDESLAGGLSNTIAGRICNHLDVNGGGYTVDGACAASLLAVATACARLADGDLDLALAGGVDVSLDPFELVGFAKAGALAANEMRVYDTRSEGFWPGEGCGFVVLERLEDALASGHRVHAVVRGWGIASDGAGGITRPEVGGQLLAIRRAYARAGAHARDAGYFEGHGTGTVVGDATELRALAAARAGGSRRARAGAAVGSIKANIGHTKAAAGVAGLLKAVLAVREGVLPPTTACSRPHPALAESDGSLRVLAEPEPWREAVRIAGVSAMGFGGIDTHAVVGAPPAARRRARLGERERMLGRSAQDAELFLFGEPTRERLAEQVERLAARAAGLSRAEMGDAAAALAARLDAAQGAAAVRGAVVAERPAELAERLGALRALLGATGNGHGPRVARALGDPPGVFLAMPDRAPRIGLLLPGQGAPVRDGGGALRRRFPAVAGLIDRAPPAGAASGPVDTSIAQPAIVAMSLAALAVLNELGIAGDVAVGHSLGELTALAWAGALDTDAVLRIATARGRAMSELARSDGAMASVALGREAAERLADGLDLTVAGLNAPAQTVLAGSAGAIDALVARARGRGAAAARLPVSHAFHSPLVEPAADELGRFLGCERVGRPRRRVVSTITGAELSRGDDLRAILCRQVTSPVLFERAARTAFDGIDLLIEAGPGTVLSGLARDFLPVPAIALDAGGESLAGVLAAAGAAWALGAPLRVDALFADRFTRPLDLDRSPLFFANPCESAPLPDDDVAAPPTATPPTATPPEADATDRLALLRALVAERAELPVDAVADDHRLLDDLHLNSIVVSEIAIEAARRLGLPPPLAPNEFANASVAELARAIAENVAHAGSDAAPDVEPPGAGEWLRPFAVDLVERPLGRTGALTRRDGTWTILARPGDTLADPLARSLDKDAPGAGTAVLLPAGPLDQHGLRLLLDGARAALAAPGPHRFILLHDGSCAGGFARSLQQEAPHCTVVLVDAPLDADAPARASAEVAAANRFVDARYGAGGVRREPVLRLLPASAADASTALGADDVVLVSGGAKGIAAECVLALARATGAAVAIVGRSDPAVDPDAAASLERMAAAGIRVGYARADVTDAWALRGAVADLERSLGAVTAVVHAAGVNEPRAIADLDEQQVRATIAPKVAGFANLLAAVDADRLRLLVAFGSIIARIGMRGDAHYALANELQTALVERFAAGNPGCSCLALESSVWAAVGMGERLGSIGSLARQGVQAIAPDAGAELMTRLAATRDRPVAVVACGRFGRPPTLALERTDLPLGRFLERPVVHYPGVELVADSDLSADLDPYLDDHVLDGERLLPAVIGLEAMAQAAGALGLAPHLFEDVRLMRPVAIPAGETTAVRIAALAETGANGRAVLRSERTGFQVDHFSARWSQDGAAIGVDDLPPPDDEPPSLDVDRLYGTLLFQSGRLRRITRYLRLTATDCVAEIEPRAPSGWFGRFLPQRLLLGDPGARDAALHAIQACVPHLRVLPVAVDAVRIAPAAQGRPAPWQVRARERSRGDGEFVYDMAIVDADGSAIERWDGLRLRAVGPAPLLDPWPEPLLAAYVERRLESLGVHVAVTNGGGPQRSRSNRAIGLATGRPVTVHHRADGRPEVHGTAVSTAHAGALTLAVSGDGPLACDLEAVAHREGMSWTDLLGGDGAALSGRIAGEVHEDPDAAATRVWAATECLRKAGIGPGAPLTLAERADDGWLTLASGSLAVATYVTRVSGVREPLALALLAGGDDARL